MKYFRISEDALKELIRESKFLDALESYGVDNWDGYDMVEDEDVEVSEEDLKEFEEIKDEITDEITDIDIDIHNEKIPVVLEVTKVSKFEPSIDLENYDEQI